MKLTEIFWEDAADHPAKDVLSDLENLKCPICAKSWLNISMKYGEFYEYTCEHLMFRWYEDGSPENIHVKPEDIEKAFCDALVKVDNEFTSKEHAAVLKEIYCWRTDEKFWQGFECPGIDEIVFAYQSGGTLEPETRHIFGVRTETNTP